MFNSVESKARRLTVENKILLLIQLWADTFMMYEDEYPYFMSTYRELRKQGVNFPLRDSSSRFMLSSMGLESPVFDNLEDANHNNIKPRTVSVVIPRSVLHEDRERMHAEKEFKRFTGGTIGVVSREKDSKNLARVTLSQADINTIKNYMEIIDDMCINAEGIADLKNSFALEIYKHALAFHARCLNIVEAKSSHGIDHQLEILLSLSEDLDTRVKLYKNTFIDLLTRKNLPKMQSKEPKNDKRSRKNSPEEIEEKEETKAPVKKRREIIKPLPPPPSNQFFQFETKQEPISDLLDFFEEKTKSSEKNPFAMAPERKSLLDVKVDLEGLIKENNVETEKVEDDFFENLANRKV
eukprot:TRINITY_DN5228_c0_g1_i1.p1 TRINITY_DN5228_c0_g1~~TRINITY_DN5228_c0_g1_i1.p1  ORF type:complete len:353 (+),score=85.16 TRINITY_DN5228_c0_g1_i1:525-1583(+)